MILRVFIFLDLCNSNYMLSIPYYKIFVLVNPIRYLFRINLENVNWILKTFPSAARLVWFYGSVEGQNGFEGEGSSFDKDCSRLPPLLLHYKLEARQHCAFVQGGLILRPYCKNSVSAKYA